MNDTTKATQELAQTLEGVFQTRSMEELTIPELEQRIRQLKYNIMLSAPYRNPYRNTPEQIAKIAYNVSLTKSRIWEIRQYIKKMKRKMK